jgi:ribosome-associated translation inhibitor RaiA
MTTMVDWQSLLTTLGSNALLLGAAAWVIKTVITEQLKRDTDSFKARIEADANIEIEKLKSSLQIAATEHQVRFSRMHERRAEVIEEAYKKLTDIFREGKRFVKSAQGNPTEKRREEFLY